MSNLISLRNCYNSAKKIIRLPNFGIDFFFCYLLKIRKMMEMEPNQESTYEPLEGQRRRLESTDSPDIDTSPPQDRNGILYIALVAAGIGFVLPYNR